MFDMSVVARGGRWLLLDESERELGVYGSRAEALRAAGDLAVADQEPRHVLIHDVGEWDEAVIDPPALH